MLTTYMLEFGVNPYFEGESLSTICEIGSTFTMDKKQHLHKPLASGMSGRTMATTRQYRKADLLPGLVSYHSIASEVIRRRAMI